MAAKSSNIGLMILVTRFSYELDKLSVNNKSRLGGCGNERQNLSKHFQSNPAQRRLFGSFQLMGKNNVK
jgi:hypothetical protein